MVARTFITVSAGILLFLGVIHLLYTFRGPKLAPRDTALEQRMKEVSPVVTRETTMWRVWTGINATHSLALIFFGLVYGYLSLMRADILFESPFLMGLGMCMLLSFAVLARLYFFSIPFQGVCVASACYLLGIVFSRWNLK